LTNLAKSYGISLKEAEKGIISHQEAVDLWFCLLDLPNGVKGRVYELEKAGYLSREILTEVITTDIWSREEVTWIFQNAPRPEALILGTDLPEQRPFYAESLNWGRAAFLACRFQQAIMAELTGGLSVEEIEKTEVKCTLEPVESFWVLKCNQKFPLPLSWMLDKLERTPEVEPGKAVLFSCRPILPTYFKSDKDWIKREIKLLRRHKTKTKFRCLLFSYEFISPDYKGDIDEVKKLVKKAARKGVTILFAPSRMGLYLDDEIQRRMLRARRLKQFPSRKAGLKLRIIETPREWWNGTDASLICRRIQNASQAAEVFAEQIVRGRDVNQYRMEFSLMCDVIETEALKSHNIIADVEGQDSENLLEALQSQDSRCHGVTFPYIRPDKMPSFRERLKSRRLRSILRKVKGGLVVTTKPWEHFQIPITMAPVRIGQTFKIPASIIKKVDTEIVRRNRERLYVNRWQTIERAHEQLRQAFRDGVPFSMASFEGRIRSAVFIEMIKDYIYSSGEAKSTELFIAYSDGSASQAFPLFSLPEIKRPLGRLFHYPVGLVSLRHMEVDQLTERALVRNREIQLCETGAEQEILAFRRTSECIDEFVRFLRREIEESQLSLSLNTLLTRRAELRNEKWDGLEMPIYHATGLEPAGIGAYRAVLEMLKKYRGQLIVIPQIYFKGIFRPAEEWY